VPLSGPVYLAEQAGQLLPGLRLALGGPVQLRLSGGLSVSQPLVARFDGIHDVPLSRLALTFAGGGPLKVLGNPCTGSLLRTTGELTGHNGASATAPARVKVRSCPMRAAARVTKARALRLTLRKGRDTRGLRTVRVTLPARATGLRATADGRRAKARVRGRTVTVQARGAREVVLRGRLASRTRRALRISATRTNGRHAALTMRPARTR
jgi:hypothetical protein